MPNRAFGTLHDPLPLPAYRGVTGSRSRPTPPGFGQIVLCRPDAWVRVSFAHTRVSIVGWIYDPDHSLPPGMYVDVPHLDCLLVAAPITLEGLDHLILKPQQLDGVVAVNVDEVLGHVAMALSKSQVIQFEWIAKTEYVLRPVVEPAKPSAVVPSHPAPVVPSLNRT